MEEVIREVRYTMAQAAIASMRAVALARYNGELGPHLMNIVLGMGLWIGQHENRPFTCAKLADFLYLPRTTVGRKLDALVERGVVERRGSHFFITQAWLDRPEAIGMIREMVQIMYSACSRLSKLDMATLDNSRTKY
jgi:hypothetical protein